MTRRDIYSLIALRMVANAETEVLIDSESKKTREVNRKNQDRAKQRLIEEIDHSPEELEAIKARRREKASKAKRMEAISAEMNRKSKATFSNKPKIKIPSNQN